MSQADRRQSALTLVLLPGMDGTGALFEPFLLALDGAFKIRVVRYPVHGAQSYAVLGMHARKALPEEGRFIILGESFSGPIAVSLAAARPAGLVGVILCASFVSNPRPSIGLLRHVAEKLPVGLAPLALLDAMLIGRYSTERLREALAAALSLVPADVLRRRLRAVLSVDVSAELRRIDVPLLYLQARYDRLVPSDAYRRIRQILPIAQIAPIPAPHFLLQAAPDEAAAAIIAFARLELGDDAA